jgi:hypothetical protein
MSDKPRPSKQEWVCEGCGLTGKVTYEPKAGVFAVVRVIRDHHETLAGKYAPTCHFDIDQVRVRNQELMYEWIAPDYEPVLTS